MLNLIVAIPINRPLVIGEIVGALYTSDDSFYRAKVLQQNDVTNYLISYIDFGETAVVSMLNIFEIPKKFMVLHYLIIIDYRN